MIDIAVYNMNSFSYILQATILLKSE